MNQYEQGEEFIEEVEGAAARERSTGPGSAPRTSRPSRRSTRPSDVARPGRRRRLAAVPAPMAARRRGAGPLHVPADRPRRRHRPGGRRCSGGADSLALLVARPPRGLEATAVHVDHGLRPGSAAEADVVAAAAAALGAGVPRRAGRRRAGPEPRGPGAAAARATRRCRPTCSRRPHRRRPGRDRAAQPAARRGLDGLGRDAARDAARRPLLRLRRAETAALCAAAGLEPVDDPTNDDPRFRRNRVRHEVLPLLDDIAERDVVPGAGPPGRPAAATTPSCSRARAPPSTRPTRPALPRRAAVGWRGAAVRAWLRARAGSARPRPTPATVRARCSTWPRARRSPTEVGTRAGAWRRTAGRLAPSTIGR